jgi:hypothetical protein
LIDVRVNIFFQVQTANINRRHQYKIVKPVCNNNARQFSFSCHRIKLVKIVRVMVHPAHALNLT